MDLSIFYQFLFVVVTWPGRRSKEVQVDVEIATGTLFHRAPGFGKDKANGLINPSGLKQIRVYSALIACLFVWLVCSSVEYDYDVIFTLPLHVCFFLLGGEPWETFRHLGIYFPSPWEIHRGKGDRFHPCRGPDFRYAIAGPHESSIMNLHLQDDI